MTFSQVCRSCEMPDGALLQNDYINECPICDSLQFNMEFIFHGRPGKGLLTLFIEWDMSVHSLDFLKSCQSCNVIDSTYNINQSINQSLIFGLLINIMKFEIKEQLKSTTDVDYHEIVFLLQAIKSTNLIPSLWVIQHQSRSLIAQHIVWNHQLL